MCNNALLYHSCVLFLVSVEYNLARFILCEINCSTSKLIKIGNKEKKKSRRKSYCALAFFFFFFFIQWLWMEYQSSIKLRYFLEFVKFIFMRWINIWEIYSCTLFLYTSVLIVTENYLREIYGSNFVLFLSYVCKSSSLVNTRVETNSYLISFALLLETVRNN